MAERLGIVIGVEGGDGTGKTGTAKDLVERIKAKGLTAIYVPIIEGSAVGKIYKSEYTTSEEMDAYRQSTGMLFSVMSTLTTVVEPLRKLYDVIVLDRTLASFYTYQILTNGHSFMKEISSAANLQRLHTPGCIGSSRSESPRTRPVPPWSVPRVPPAVQSARRASVVTGTRSPRPWRRH